MTQVMNFLKTTIAAVKGWFKSNGVSGILGLIAGIVLFLAGYNFWAGISLGVFVTRNWDIIVEWFKENFSVPSA